MANGEGKQSRFQKFYKRVGKPEYLPDFLDSLVAVMADGDRCVTERTLAWSKYRSWGNQNEYAVHIYGHNGDRPVETQIGQQNCARDLALLEAGVHPAWLDAPLDKLQSEMDRLQIVPLSKSSISFGFQTNEKSGMIAPNTGRRIEPIVSPKAQFTPPKVQHSLEFAEFQEHFKLQHSLEFAEREFHRSKAEFHRSEVDRINKIELSEYKKWLKSHTPPPPAPPPIIPINPISSNGEAGQSVSPEEQPAEPPTTQEKPTDRPTAPLEDVPTPDVPSQQLFVIPEAAELERAKALDDLLKPLCKKLRDVPTDNLFNDVLRILADTPLNYLQARINDRWKAINKMGMLIPLAQDAARAWAAERADQQKPTDETIAAQVEAEAAAIVQAEKNREIDAQVERALVEMPRDQFTELYKSCKAEAKRQWPRMAPDQLKSVVEQLVRENLRTAVRGVGS